MADNYTLTKAQRNRVFEEFLKLNIDPRDFEWVTGIYSVDGGPVSVLRHSSLTAFSFAFGPTVYEWVPSDKGRRLGRFEHHGLDDLIQQRIALGLWLAALKPELEEPDLWEAAKQGKLTAQAATSEETENRPFTPAEQKFIAEQLKSVQESVIKSHDLKEDQTKGLEAGIQYLIESSERLGRKDWLNLAIGTAVSVAVGAAFAPDAANDLLQTLISSVQSLFTAAVKLLAAT